MAQSSRRLSGICVYGRYLIFIQSGGAVQLPQALVDCPRAGGISAAATTVTVCREEAEANAFAASLLMPTAAAGELIHRVRLRDAKDLCDIFGVSLQSAQLRMQQLERTGTQLTELEEQLRQRYLPVIEEYLVAPVITLPRSRLEPPPLLL